MRDKMTALLKRAFERTQQGILSWKEGPGRGELSVNLPKYSLVLSKDMSTFTFRLYDDEGKIVESMSTSAIMSGAMRLAATEEQLTMQELWELAWRQARHVNEKLDEALEMLG